MLSGDVLMLEALGVIIARRIDAIRLVRERDDRERREQEIAKLAAEAELRALRAQLNPHFLFNALTTIGYLIQTAPPKALRTLMRLTALLRSVLRSEGAFTTLGRELEIVEAYLEIERARFEDRLQVQIDILDELRSMRVPPLLLQPLVENAVKHGVSPQRAGGRVTVRATLDRTGDEAFQLRLTVHDTGMGTTDEVLEQGRRRGVGLQNVQRRLAHQYGAAASLSIRSSPGRARLPRFVCRYQPGWSSRRRRLAADVRARLRVVIADDERPARSFLAALLRSFDDVVLVSEAQSGNEAVAIIERDKPDLALLDLQMPELDGLAVVRA